MSNYIVKEIVGLDIIDYIEFDTFDEAKKFMDDHNSRIDNSFSAPECEHWYVM